MFVKLRVQTGFEFNQNYGQKIFFLIFKADLAFIHIIFLSYHVNIFLGQIIVIMYSANAKIRPK